MTDIWDRAQAAELRDREQALARHAADHPAVDPAQWRKRSSKWCKGPACGERIPDERRRAVPGVEFCVECQALKEHADER